MVHLHSYYSHVEELTAKLDVRFSGLGGPVQLDGDLLLCRAVGHPENADDPFGTREQARLRGIIVEMAISIPSGLTDDNDFVNLMNALLNALVVQQTPEQLWVIQIDNWFDHKWLRYSGSGSVASEFPANWTYSFMDRFTSVKAQFWRDKLTFPPFAPDRVVSQWSFLHSKGSYIEVPLPKVPHRESRRRSHSNLNRRVEDFVRSASFVWYSGNTLKNGRGSLMVYSVGSDKPVCWFAAFGRKSGWMLERTKGIEKERVSRLLNGE